MNLNDTDGVPVVAGADVQAAGIVVGVLTTSKAPDGAVTRNGEAR